MLVIWLSQASATFSIFNDSVLETEICRTVVAPQEGYIAEANVRAGDLVRDGRCCKNRNQPGKVAFDLDPAIGGLAALVYLEPSALGKDYERIVV